MVPEWLNGAPLTVVLLVLGVMATWPVLQRQLDRLVAHRLESMQAGLAEQQADRRHDREREDRLLDWQQTLLDRFLTAQQEQTTLLQKLLVETESLRRASEEARIADSRISTGLAALVDRMPGLTDVLTPMQRLEEWALDNKRSLDVAHDHIRILRATLSSHNIAVPEPHRRRNDCRHKDNDHD